MKGLTAPPGSSERKTQLCPFKGTSGPLNGFPVTRPPSFSRPVNMFVHGALWRSCSFTLAPRPDPHSWLTKNATVKGKPAGHCKHAQQLYNVRFFFSENRGRNISNKNMVIDCSTQGSETNSNPAAGWAIHTVCLKACYLLKVSHVAVERMDGDRHGWLSPCHSTRQILQSDDECCLSTVCLCWREEKRR